MSARRQPRIALLGTVLALATLGVAPALAASSSNAVLADCGAHPGGLTGSYTAVQLQHALAVMPAETKEYTSCPDVINRALLAALGKSRGNGTRPTATGGGSGSLLPTPVIIILVVLVLAAVTFAAVAIRRRRDGGAGDDGDAGGRGRPGG